MAIARNQLDKFYLRLLIRLFPKKARIVILDRIKEAYPVNPKGARRMSEIIDDDFSWLDDPVLIPCGGGCGCDVTVAAWDDYYEDYLCDQCHIDKLWETFILDYVIDTDDDQIFNALKDAGLLDF
jgi:hypothetical protein